MCATFPRIESNRRGGGGDRHPLIRANFLTGPIWNSKRSFSELGRELTLEIYDHLAPKKSAGSRGIFPRTKRNVENGKWTEISKKRSEKDGWKGGKKKRKKGEILTRRDHSGGFVKLFNGKRRVRLLAFVYRWDLSTRSHPPPCFHRSARSSGGKGGANNSSLSRRIKLRRKEGTCLRHGVFVENGWALGNNKKEALRIDSRVTMILFFFSSTLSMYSSFVSFVRKCDRSVWKFLLFSPLNRINLERKLRWKCNRERANNFWRCVDSSQRINSPHSK